MSDCTGCIHYRIHRTSKAALCESPKVAFDFVVNARREPPALGGCSGFYYEERVRDFESEPVEPGWWRYESV